MSNHRCFAWLVALVVFCAAAPASGVTSALFNPDPPSDNVVIRINAGGPMYVDGMGQVWESDRYSTAGGVRASRKAASLAGDDKVLKTSRWALHLLGSASSNVDYDIPVTPNRSYSVELLIPGTSPALYDRIRKRNREVDIWIQHKRPYDNLMIKAGAGGVMRVVTPGYLVGETGILKIRIVSFGSAPTLAGLVVYDVTEPMMPTAPSSVAAPAATPVAMPRSSPTRRPTMAPVMMPVMMPVPVPAPIMIGSQKLLLRLNAGSFAYVDPVTGTMWSDDAFVNVGSTFVLDESQVILGADDQSVYRSERYDPVGFTYNIPVPETATYQVVLHFAEIFWMVTGARVFDVAIEGNVVLSDLDIYARVGGFTKLVEEFDVAVNDGFLTIEFRSKKDSAKVSGIEVYMLSL